MMGSGKSIVGKRLAKKIDYCFVDTDKLIEEKMGKSISTIFKEDGEKYFRELEENITVDFLQKEKFVISLGGGAVLSNNIRNIIVKNSYNIYLKASINILIKRLVGSKNRPLINNKDIKETLNKLIKEREMFYNKADLVINNNVNINDVVNNIIKKL